MKVLFIILALSTTAQAQVSISTPSFMLWGQVKNIGHTSIDYENISLHYFYNTEPTDYNYIFGASYSLINYKDYFKVGYMITSKPFPRNTSVKYNFMLNIGYSFKYLRVSYNHVSNGFGIIHHKNQGFDNISLSISIL